MSRAANFSFRLLQAGSLVFLLLNCCTADAQTAQSLPKKVLHAASSTLSDISTFSSFGSARCDAKGNLYFQMGEDSKDFRRGVVMRVSKSSSLPMLYSAPASDAKEQTFVNFTVAPSGHVYLLELEADPDTYKVFEFSSDETTPDGVALQVPENVFATAFTVSQDGALLFAGYYDERAAEASRGKPFSGIFDRSGRLRRELSAEVSEAVDTKEARKKLPDGAATAGPDGNFYFVQGSTLTVLSANGDIVREVPFQKPEADLLAKTVTVSEEMISIQFYKANKEGSIDTEFLVLDAATGAPYGLYTPAEELGNTCLCFTPRSGYTFLRVENGKLKFLTAPLS